MIYLDHNATTPLDDEAKKALTDAYGYFGNPSSSHSLGMAAKALVETSRQQIGNLIGSKSSEIIFTSGGTESNNLAIIGTAYKYKKGHIITSIIEHPSVVSPLRWLQKNGFEATYLHVDSHGRLDPEDVRKNIRTDTILITIMHSNNETGVLQPIHEIGMISREYGIAFHSDAAQSIGKLDMNVAVLPVDMMTIVSHKLYGPKGVGALYIRDLENQMPHADQEESLSYSTLLAPHPILFGAGHERGLRPGTENVICICGFGKACEVASREMLSRYDHTFNLREMFFALLKDKLVVRLNGHETLRLPNTLNISIKGIIAEDLIVKLQGEIAFSAGSACHAGIRKPSPVLKAMGLSDTEALSSIRLSVGKDNSITEIRSASEMLSKTIKSLR